MRTLAAVDLVAALAVCGAFVVWLAWIWVGEGVLFRWRLRRTAQRLGMTVRVIKDDSKGRRR